MIITTKSLVVPSGESPYYPFCHETLYDIQVYFEDVCKSSRILVEDTSPGETMVSNLQVR